MKIIKIGQNEYSLMTTLFDINDERFNVFKQYFLQVVERMDRPLFSEAYSRYIHHFNSGNHADGVIEWHNFKKSLQLGELNYDAYSICFCFICLEKGEDQTNNDVSLQLAKLDKLRKDGLNRGMVEDSVRNFMKASPEAFGVYLEMLEMMKLFSKEEILRE